MDGVRRIANDDGTWRVETARAPLPEGVRPPRTEVGNLAEAPTETPLQLRQVGAVVQFERRRAGFEIEALYADVAAAAARNHCQRTLAREAFIRCVRTRILDFDVGNDRSLRVVKGIDFDTKRTAYVRITAVCADQQLGDHAQCAIPARGIYRDAIGMDIETVELG